MVCVGSISGYANTLGNCSSLQVNSIGPKNARMQFKLYTPQKSRIRIVHGDK